MSRSRAIGVSRVVFWDPCPSPHKEGLFSALSARDQRLEITCCADHELTQDRQALGWTDGKGQGYDTIVAPADSVIRAIARERPSETLHIFSGIRWLRTIVRGLQEVRTSGARLAVMSEPRVREDWKGELRLIQSWLTEGWLRKNVEFVLAIGANGPPWFVSAGYPADRVFPFAYFVDPPPSVAIPRGDAQQDHSPIRIGYAGRLVRMKGIFDLAYALAQLDGRLVFSVAGAGPGEGELKSLCARLGVNAQFKGVLPIGMMGEFMNNLDVLVLPSSSSSDGWGVVVSEALMSGAAVIATPCVGASVMLGEPAFGVIVPVGSPDCIAQAIRSLSEAEAFTRRARSSRMTLARARLSADSGAKYLLEIIRWSEAGGARPATFYDHAPHHAKCSLSEPATGE